MNAFKISLMVVAALVCFAFGVYFHSALPDGGRDIASISSAKARVPSSKGNVAPLPGPRGLHVRKKPAPEKLSSVIGGGWP